MGQCLGKKPAETTSRDVPTNIVGGPAAAAAAAKKAPGFYAISDKYNTIEEVQKALRTAGLESSDLILAVDFTKTNEVAGRQSFGGKNLHDLNSAGENPYQQVISIVGRTLEVFDDDKLIPAYGFGQKGPVLMPFKDGEEPCAGLMEVLRIYNQLTPKTELGSASNFAPAIHKAIEIVVENQAYHILVIVTNGQVTNRAETEKAIIEASKHPISIVVIGVGDGPWEMMQSFDDEIPERMFDNFQFVPFDKTMKSIPAGQDPDAAFATAALMEIPEQYKLICGLGYL